MPGEPRHDARHGPTAPSGSESTPDAGASLGQPISATPGDARTAGISGGLGGRSDAPVADASVPEQQIPTWEEVAREYGRFIYTVAFRLTGKPEEAEDLVQDVLLRVRKGLPNYTPGSMEGWLSRITTNAFLDDVRRRKRRPTEALPEDPERVLEGAPSADEALARVQLPDHVQQALRSLPDDYRAAVVLCDVVGFSYDEISDSLGVPLGTVRSRIHRGRSMLKERLQ